MATRPFIINRDVIADSGLLVVTASRPPSRYGNDDRYSLDSAVVEPKWESLENWIHWVFHLSTHGIDRVIPRIRWLFETGGMPLQIHTPAGPGDTAETKARDLYQQLLDTSTRVKTDGDLGPEDFLSCRAWTRYDDDPEPDLHHVYNLDWIRMDGGQYEEWSSLYTWDDEYGGDA
jgi:hypothetical protein